MVNCAGDAICIAGLQPILTAWSAEDATDATDEEYAACQNSATNPLCAEYLVCVNPCYAKTCIATIVGLPGGTGTCCALTQTVHDDIYDDDGSTPTDALTSQCLNEHQDHALTDFWIYEDPECAGMLQCLCQETGYCL